MANCFICNFFKRAFLYQILIIIAALKLKDAFRYNKDFFNRIIDLLESLNLPGKLANYLPRNKEYLHKGFLIAIIVFASFSMLGVNFFKILSGISCLLLAFLYHNPILKLKEVFSKKVEFNFEFLEENLPDLEFILYVCIAFAMFVNACSQTECPKEKDKDEEAPIEEDRENKQNNKKGAKGNKKVDQNVQNKGGKKNKKKKD